MAGGLCWLIKGGAILITGDQPPLLFELGAFLLPVSLIGLDAALGGRGGRVGKAGLVLSAVAVISALLAGLGAWLGPDDWIPTEDTATVLTPFIVLTGLGTVLGLVLLGIAVFRTKALRRPWHILPIAIAASIVPLMIAGGALASINERLLELPLVLLGGAWVLLGVTLLRQESASESPERLRVQARRQP